LGIGGRVIRVEGNRTTEVNDGFSIRVDCLEREESLSKQVLVVGCDIRSLPAGTHQCLRQQLTLKCLNDRPRDLALHFEDILKVAVEVLGPELVTGVRADDFYRDANLIS
jgi:hypothetical protein